MAHFAEIDENNKVLRVLVTDNNDPNNDEGYQWLVDTFGGRWIKTSYNGNIRRIFAGKGMTYNEKTDAFVPEKPSNHPSFVWSEEEYNWINPVAKPTEDPDTLFIWFEEELCWKRFNKETLQEITND
jgi:hypothetical protein